MKSKNEIERINEFVALQTVEDINHRLLRLVFLNTVLLAFLATTILNINKNFISSGLPFFLPVSIMLSCWAFWLKSKKNIPQKQISFNLHIAVVHTFYSTLFYFLAILYAGESWGMVVLAGLISETLMLFFLMRYRVQLYSGRKKARGGNPNFRIIGMAVPICVLVFWGLAKFIELNLFAPILFMILGFIFSAGVSFLGNYFIAKKYRNYLIFDDSPKKRTSKQL